MNRVFKFSKPVTLKKLIKPVPNPVLDAALSYAALGWHVLPIHGVENGLCLCPKGANCDKPGKHPITPNGVKDATTDNEMIKNWFANGTKNNLAIATGRVSGLVVFDVDPRNGGGKNLAALNAIELCSRTIRSITSGGGRHIYFLYPDEGIKTSHGKTFGPGIDIQSDGAYVVAPPSVHASSKKYQWSEDRNPETQALASLPPKWLEQCHSTLPRPATLVDPFPDNEAISEGRRNTELTSLAGKLVNASLSREEVLDALWARNERACKPPLGREEVEAIATSVSRYPARLSEGDEAEALMVMVLEQQFSNGNQLVYAADGRFWHFSKTHWIPLGEQVLSRIVLNQLQSLPRRSRSNTSSLIRQTCSLLKAKVAQADDVLGFNTQPAQVINCTNGELWLGNHGAVELKSHDPKSFLRHCMPVKYDPAAKCPRYSKAVGEIFSKSRDSKAVTDFWHELMGYTMQPSRKLAIIAIGSSKGSNAKTTLAQTLVRMLGQKLVTAMPVQDLEGNRFVVGSLLGKYLLLDDDVKAGIRLPDGQLKKLSEEKTLTGERKFGDPFTFTARLLPILLCNHPPRLPIFPTECDDGCTSFHSNASSRKTKPIHSCSTAFGHLKCREF